MNQEDETKKAQIFPSIPIKSAWSPHSSIKAVQEAPYRALVGVAIDGRVIERHPNSRFFRARNQTGMTNRWRLPQSLYSDFLGTSQALKAINVPFDQGLVKNLTKIYPSVNPMLCMCEGFPEMNERNWSLLKKINTYKPTTDEEDVENRLPPI